MTTAAPRGARVLAQTRFEVGTLLRNGEQLLVSLILPALVLIGLSLTKVPSLGAGRRIDIVAPGVLALCVMSAAFTSQAISTGFDRRYSVLRYLGVTPLGRGGLIAGKILATFAVELIQVVVLGAIAVALGWRPELSGLPYAVIFLAVGTGAFVSLAMLLAGTLRAEAVLALANLIWILLLAGGGVVIPRTQFPGAASHLAAALPSAALSDGLRAALIHGRLDVLALGILIAWGAVGGLLASRWFRWSD